MSTVNSAYSSSSRITGMFSDLDTDALVESMCSNQQVRIDTHEQQKTSCEWYNEAVNDVVSAIKDFSNMYCSVLGTSSMIKSSTYSTFSVTSDRTSNEVSLTASSKAEVGDFSVKIIQLAENANVSSSGRISSNGTEISSSNTATLAELSFANALTFGSDGKCSFAINGKTFSFSSNITLQNMINTVNTDTDANVTMKYSRLTDGFTITADSGGIDSRVIIENISGNAFGENSAFQIGTGTISNGVNSIAEINETTITRDSNEYTIDNITYELNKVTAGTSDEYVNFTVRRDYSATVDAVGTFVDAFNTLITKLTALTTATDYSSDYKPLTEAQKEDMTDDQITAWNKKAKNGILRYDSNLETLISNLKDAFFSSAGGTGKASTSIGISSASYYGTNKGLLALDRDALSAALESNPEEVISMFTNGNTSSTNSEQGLVYKVKSALIAYQDNATDSVSNTEDKIDDINTEIDDLNDKLDTMAERYYAKFSAMETALSKLNSQASYISQLFA